MGWLWLVLAVVVIALVLVATAKAGKTGGSVDFPYRPAKELFSPAERAFLGALDQAAGPDFRVFGKVRVNDLAEVKPGLSNGAKQGALNKVAYRHFDFVVCRVVDLGAVCAVELDDKSHASKRAQARDAFVVGVCEAIGLPLLRVPAARGYSVSELRAQLLGRIQPNKAP